MSGEDKQEPKEAEPSTSAGAEADAAGAETEAARAEGKPHREMQWFTMLLHLHLHVFALYALVLVFSEVSYSTTLFAATWGALSLVGVTAGAHRLWAHRCYEASTPLRLALLAFQTASGTGSVYDWVLAHRVHHKFHGTDDDPFNHKRGLLYAHVFSRISSRSSNWEALAAQVDMSDIEAEALLVFQRRFYWILMPLLCILVPIDVPLECWGEDLFTAVLVCFLLRYVVVLHLNWLITSGILIWGLRREDNYSMDKNMVFLVTLSLWPQYHYLLPWDYQTGEFGDYGKGLTTSLIRAWTALGWAGGLRTVDTEGVRRAICTAAERGGSDLLEAVEAEGRACSERIRREHLAHQAPLF